MVGFEGFRPISGFSDYIIDEQGTVISFKRKKPRELKHIMGGCNNCYYVTMVNSEGIRCCRGVNSLVYQTFGHPIQGYRTINHFIYELEGEKVFRSVSELAKYLKKDTNTIWYHLKRYGTTPPPECIPVTIKNVY